MFRAFIRSASVLLLICLGDQGKLRSEEGRAPARGDSSLEILQRLIDTARDDEATVIEVVVRNRGNQLVDEVTIRGAMPKGHELRSAVPELEKSAEQFLWKVGKIGAGETKKIQLQFLPSPNSTVSDLKVDLKATFRSAAVSVLEAPVKQAAPKISILVPESVVVGVPAPIKIQISNRSNRPSRNVLMQANLGAGLTHISGKELEKQLGPLEAGETKVVQLEAIATKAGELRGTVRVRGEGSGWAEKEFSVQAREIRLSMSAIAPAICDAGTSVVATIGVCNNGTDAAHRVRVLIRLPKGLTFSAAVGGTFFADENCVVFDLGEVKPGERRDLRLKANADQLGDQRISAVVSSISGDQQSHSVSVQVRDAVPKTPPFEGRGP